MVSASRPFQARLAEDRVRAGGAGARAAGPVTSAGDLDGLADAFRRKPKDGLDDVLGALVALGLARRIDGDRYVS